MIKRLDVFIILAAIILKNVAAGVTQIDSKVIVENTSWSGEVVVFGTVVVERNAVLTVAPGTIVKFVATDGDLNIRGTLLANGALGQEITFTSHDENTKWAGILFSGEKAGDAINKLSYCIIKFAEAGIRCFEMASVNVENCSFTRNNLAAVLAQSSNVAIRHSEFIENINGGIFCEQANIRVNNNYFANNNNFAINCVKGSEVVIVENLIAKHRNGIVFSFVGTKGQVRGNIIRDNECGIFTEKLAELDVSSNTLEENGYGIYVRQGSNPRIFMNEITRNKTGIFMTDIFYLAVNQNNIYGNEEYEIGLNRVPNDSVENFQEGVAGSTTMFKSPAARKSLEKSNGLSCEYIDARGNFWGQETTREMQKKGVAANISKILDFYDNPTFNVNNKDFKTKYVLHSEWKEGVIIEAGAKKEFLYGVQGK